MTPQLVLVWLVDVAIKTLLLLALAFAIVGSMKRASAAARHSIWILALTGSLFLPGFSVLLPQWRVSILPTSLLPSTPLINFVEDGSPQQKDATLRYFGALIGLRGSIWDMAGATDTSGGSRSRNWFDAHNGPTLLLATWLTGMGLMMIPWLVGSFTVWRIGRRAKPITDAFIANMFRGLLWEYSIHRRVKLLVGTQSMTPLAWGVFRPCVLLPPEALRWPADRLRSVLLHELAHVRRWDCLTQLLAQMVCAIHWFNPMAWLMARQMRAEHERACDDMVLAWGLGEACYAEHLVAIARSLRAPGTPWMAAVAMARGSQLRQRLVSILDTSRPRGRFGKRAILIAAALALAIVAPLSMLHGADPPATTLAPTTAPAASPLNTTALLVTDGNYFLERIFQSMPPLKSRIIKPADYEQSGPGDAGLVIFDRYTPLKTPPIPCIFFAAVSTEGPTRANQQILNDVHMEVVKRNHPILQNLDLSRIYANQSLSLQPSEQATILVNGNNEPVILLEQRDQQQCMIVAFDIMQSNWPLRPSFPVFMYRAVENLLTTEPAPN